MVRRKAKRRERQPIELGAGLKEPPQIIVSGVLQLLQIDRDLRIQDRGTPKFSAMTNLQPRTLEDSYPNPTIKLHSS